jgi:hypothetical protein
MVDSKTSANANNAIEPGSEPASPDAPSVAHDSSTVDGATSSPSNETPVTKAPRHELVPGLYADELVLPWESEQELCRLHADFMEEFPSRGRTQEETVFDLTHHTWRQRRAARLDQIKLLKTARLAGPSPEAKKQSAKALDDAKKAAKLLQGASKNLEDIPVHGDTHRPRDLRKAILQLRELQDVVGNALIPALTAIAADKTKPSSGVPTMDVETIERSITVTTPMAIRIDRTFSRLFSLKTHKRLNSTNGKTGSSANNSIASLPAAASAPLVPNGTPAAEPDQISPDQTQARTKSRRSNALLHGVYACEVVLPGESEDQFNQLYADLKQDWSSQGRSEDEALLEVARLRWSMRRVLRFEQEKLMESPLLASLGPAPRRWPELLDDLNLDQQSDKALGAAKGFLRILEPVLNTYLQPFNPRLPNHFSDYIDEARYQLLRLQDFFEDPIMTFLTGASATTTTAGDDFDFAIIEQCMKLTAKLDARLDKALSRLVSLQSQRHLMSSAS